VAGTECPGSKRRGGNSQKWEKLLKGCISEYFLVGVLGVMAPIHQAGKKKGSRKKKGRRGGASAEIGWGGLTLQPMPESREKEGGGSKNKEKVQHLSQQKTCPNQPDIRGGGEDLGVKGFSL